MPIAEQNHGNCRQWDPTAGAPALATHRLRSPGAPGQGPETNSSSNQLCSGLLSWHRAARF